MGTTTKEYKGRGLRDGILKTSLDSGKLKKMLKVIIEDKNKDLDVQIRNNYLNIYYKGGNIAKVNSEQSIEFDMFYFYQDEDKPKKEILKDASIMAKLKKQRNDLITKFKKHNYDVFFEEAKEVMEKWLKIHPKPERMEQHQMSLDNKYGKSNYTIIDLEYQVSTKSPFACEFTPKGKTKPKKPRFDIIAVDGNGQLCVIELKKGEGALKGTSGLKEHWYCYDLSVGINHKPFVEEMKMILQQKQEYDLIDDKVKITKAIPKFMFAYAFDKKTSIISQESAFINEYNELYKEIEKNIDVIKINPGTFKLLNLWKL